MWGVSWAVIQRILADAPTYKSSGSGSKDSGGGKTKTISLDDEDSLANIASAINNLPR